MSMPKNFCSYYLQYYYTSYFTCKWISQHIVTVFVKAFHGDSRGLSRKSELVYLLMGCSFHFPPSFYVLPHLSPSCSLSTRNVLNFCHSEDLMVVNYFSLSLPWKAFACYHLWKGIFSSYETLMILHPPEHTYVHQRCCSAAILLLASQLMTSLLPTCTHLGFEHSMFSRLICFADFYPDTWYWENWTGFALGWFSSCLLCWGFGIF